MSKFLERYVEKVSASIIEEPEVLDYLTGRGLTVDDIKKYHIGFSSLITPASDGSADYEGLKKKSYDWKAIKGKIIYPITACNGSVVGITARRFDRPGAPEDDKVPKYRHLVTAESEKVGAFFGIGNATEAILDKGYVYVVEGAMDCISLAKALPNTVSTLTSMINRQQMWTLTMMAREVVVVFDPDGAGRKGSDMAEKDYGTQTVKVRDLGYADPNKCLVDMGIEAFREYARRKLSFVSFSGRQ